MTTFDWYLLRRYLQLCLIFFLSAYGLYVVIDGFSNVDEYQKNGSGTLEVLVNMGKFYWLHVPVFLDMVGNIISIIAIMAVFALIYKKSEIQPILAAGVPLYRLTLPFVVGTLLLNCVLILNQEMVLPRVVPLVTLRETGKESGYRVEPVYDYRTQLHLDGFRLYPLQRRMTRARFILGPALMDELTTLQAEEAIYFPASGERPAGWLLRKPTPEFASLTLSQQGQEIVRGVQDSPDVFVFTDVSPDHLYQRNRSFQSLSTSELIRRMNNPAYGALALKHQTQHLHSRLTRPFTPLISIFIVVPLIVRKENQNLLLNMAKCTTVLIGALLLINAFEYLGSKQVLRPDLAAWMPLVICGALAGWYSGLAQS